MARVLNDVKTDGKTTAKKETSPGAPLSREELRNMDAYWRACNYLAAGMIYLRSNPLLRDVQYGPSFCRNAHWLNPTARRRRRVHASKSVAILPSQIRTRDFRFALQG